MRGAVLCLSAPFTTFHPAAQIAAVAAATPQERAAAAVPAFRRGANNERWCCCQLAATAASRLRAPMFQALPAFHVQCSSLTPAGEAWSSLRRAAAGEGAEAHDLQSGEVLGACPRGRRRGGLQLYQLRAAWGATGQLSGIWLGLWVSASGGAAQSASIFIFGL